MWGFLFFFLREVHSFVRNFSFTFFCCEHSFWSLKWVFQNEFWIMFFHSKKLSQNHSVQNRFPCLSVLCVAMKRIQNNLQKEDVYVLQYKALTWETQDWEVCPEPLLLCWDIGIPDLLQGMTNYTKNILFSSFCLFIMGYHKEVQFSLRDSRWLGSGGACL